MLGGADLRARARPLPGRALASACGCSSSRIGFGPPIGIGRWRLRLDAERNRVRDRVVPARRLREDARREIRTRPRTPEVRAATPSPRRSRAKPLWQKLAIVFAGPGHEPAAAGRDLRGDALCVGMPRPEPRDRHGRAGLAGRERAGLAPATASSRSTASRSRWWDDFEERAAQAPGASARARAAQRGDERVERALELERPRGAGRVRRACSDVGWVGARPLAGSRAVVGVPNAEAPAATARGCARATASSRVAGAAGRGLDRLRGGATRRRPRAPCALRVERAATARRSRERDAARSAGARRVDGARRGARDRAGRGASSRTRPAEQAGLAPGDLIARRRRRAGRAASLSFAELVRASGGRPLQLACARGGERRADPRRSRELAPIDVGLGIPETRYLIGITRRGRDAAGRRRLDQERNPLVAVPRAVGMTADVTQHLPRAASSRS